MAAILGLAEVCYWPIADTPATDCRGSFRG